MKVDYKRIIWWLEFLIPIAIAIPFCFKQVTLDEKYPQAAPCLGITLLTALFWVFEPIPIVITSFFPVFLMPLFHVSSSKVIASTMWSDTSMVFLGGFIFSIAMVKWNLHSRIAIKTVLIFGLRPWLLLLGIMLVTTFLGMWISNTACALTMIPNAVAIITKLEEITGDPEMIDPFARCLFLAIAYSCSVGGFITLIGTPPNLILAQIAKERFPLAKEIGFTEFMFVSLPISISILIIMYFYFVIVFLRKVKIPKDIDSTVFRQNYEKLGKMKPAEWFIVFFFVLLACLWLFRSDLQSLIGWANRIYPADGSSFISDGTVAILLSMMLFIVNVPMPNKNEEKQMSNAEIDLEIQPQSETWRKREERELADLSGDDELNDEDSELIEEQTEVDTFVQPPISEKPKNKKGCCNKDVEWVPLLDWTYTQNKIPWTIIFLFSGGFCLNQGFKDSGMDIWLGESMQGLTKLPLFALLLVILIVTAVLGSVASNTACANILIPIMAVFAQNSGKYHPWIMMFPVCFMTSCCFLLPVSTPPNLIAYGYGRLKMTDFLIHGSLFTVLSMFIIIGMCLGLLPAVFDAGSFPDWALPANSTSINL
ncbi:Sodium:sulfate symporter transmembrane region family protein [Tritrichomonas foetus]|uniref:Sodium:sulfate symporter transmembrane region family protein n=1 Tax=Tritrichomonas foetus TaxID=1144522 RepID=A0A1J4K5Q2_9EUKA|nr:Sodium:sulfate symporter transmembrane region family protein [Tritrichomonas foetus]|eukprot:OHT06322.1 Sodium:sulfate symporter transmembrane region family protein [Tritrichomonas foetus]